MPSDKPQSSGQMSKADTERIQPATAKSGGDMSTGGFPARAQSAADRNANAENMSGDMGGKKGSDMGGDMSGKMGSDMGGKMGGDMNSGSKKN